jgi:cell division protein FtsW (lipid II flippase)
MGKILCTLIVAMMFIMMACSVVFATDSSPGTAEPQNEFISWAYLGTMTGAVAATTLIVQFLKVPIDKVWKIPTRFIVYVFSALILVAAECITQGGITWARVGLILLNAIIAATAAMGSYEITFAKSEKTSVSARDKPG